MEINVRALISKQSRLRNVQKNRKQILKNLKESKMLIPLIKKIVQILDKVHLLFLVQMLDIVQMLDKVHLFYQDKISILYSRLRMML